MRIYLILILVVVFSSCVRNKNGQALQNATPTNSKVFEVIEVIQATSYSYLKVKENFGERWVAVSKQDIKLGDVFYYDEALEMKEFKSKDLDRTFDVVYFVNEISKTPIVQNKPDWTAGHTGKVKQGNVEVTLEKSESEITLAKVFGNREIYSAKDFEIRGVVVKVNKQVMGKNWIHIQDGTNDAGNFDLTITTQELAEIGDEVTFKGKLTLKKDFGSGYFYEVIMENAILVNKKPASVQL